MIFLFPRWDMLISWRVCPAGKTNRWFGWFLNLSSTCQIQKGWGIEGVGELSFCSDFGPGSRRFFRFGTPGPLDVTGGVYLICLRYKYWYNRWYERSHLYTLIGYVPCMLLQSTVSTALTICLYHHSYHWCLTSLLLCPFCIIAFFKLQADNSLHLPGQVSACPKAGWQDGCGGQLNHYTAPRVVVHYPCCEF